MHITAKVGASMVHFGETSAKKSSSKHKLTNISSIFINGKLRLISSYRLLSACLKNGIDKLAVHWSAGGQQTCILTTPYTMWIFHIISTQYWRNIQDWSSHYSYRAVSQLCTALLSLTQVKLIDTLAKMSLHNMGSYGTMLRSVFWWKCICFI